MRAVLSVMCRTSYSNVTQQHDQDKGGAMDSLQAKGSGAFTITAVVQLPDTLYITHTSDVFFSDTEDDRILIFCFFIFVTHSDVILTCRTQNST